MPYDMILAGAAALVVVVLLVIRTNSAVVFFSLVAGAYLANRLGSEASLVGSTLIKDSNVNHSMVSLLFILLPSLLVTFFMRTSVPASKMALNLLPSLAVGGLLVLLVVPLLPGELKVHLTDNSSWDILDKFQPIILIGGSVTSVLALGFLSKKTTKKDKK